MARDIYVMLYTFCGGNDTVDYTTTTTPYTAQLTREMAQFAVNLVDSLDTDNVITIFEYDTNLANGWGMGDNAYLSNDDPQVGERAVVFGIERQELTFSGGPGFQSGLSFRSDQCSL